MTYAILLTSALGVFASSVQAQLAQPPAGVSEGLLKELINACPANPDLANLDTSPVVGLGRSGQRPLSGPSRRRSHASRCTQAKAEVGLWTSWWQEHVFTALGGIRQSLHRE